MGTAARQDDPMLRLQYYKETGQTEDATRYEQYLRETKQWRDPVPAVPRAASESTGALARNRPNPTGDFEAVGGMRAPLDVPRGFLGEAVPLATTHVLNTAQGFIPERGLALAGMAGSRIPKSVPLVGSDRPLSYDESLATLRERTNEIPQGLRTLERVGGSLLALPALPANPAAAGAIVGGTSAAFDADRQPVRERAAKTIFGTAAGATAGKAGELIATGTRGLIGKLPGRTVGARALARKDAMQAADKVNYGAAETEGATTAATQDVIDALDSPLVKPFVDRLRSSAEFASADENTLLRETFKLMGKQEGGLTRKLKEAYDADVDLTLGNIRAGKELLRKAAPTTMPSFVPATETHAQHAGNLQAVGEAKDAAKRLIRGSDESGKKVTTQSKEAFMRRIGQMSPERAVASREGVMGQLSRDIGLNFNPLTGFGAGTSLARINRAGPALRQLDRGAGEEWKAFLAQMGLLGANAGLPR